MSNYETPLYRQKQLGHKVGGITGFDFITYTTLNTLNCGLHLKYAADSLVVAIALPSNSRSMFYRLLFNLEFTPSAPHVS